MKSTIIKRGKWWSVVLDLGEQACEVCPGCTIGRGGKPVDRILWLSDGRRRRSCPECEGPLRDSQRRRREWHSGFERKRDAETAAIELLGRMQRGDHVAPSTQTLREYLLNDWLPVRQERIEANTWEIEAVQVRAYVLPRLGARPLQDLTPAELEHFYAELRSNGRRSGPGGLAPKTIKNVHGILRKALGDAMRLGKLARNPADHAESPKVTRGKMRVWTPEQLRHFLMHMQTHRLYATYLLAASTGMRRSELLGIPWEALDLEHGRLSVRQTLVVVRGKPTIRSLTKTSSSRRTIALDPGSVEELGKWQEHQLFERLEWGDSWQDQGLVFTREDGSPVNPNWWSRTFNRNVRQADLPKIPPKNLRHTHATLALEAGVDLRVVSGRLGHASVAITGDVYAQFIDRMDQQAADQVAALVFGPR